ncbi:MAG: ORF6N domain-containing protein [Bacilli bacterium]|nr:ORF6N domain-containing protein [Bacilli bacterium]
MSQKELTIIELTEENIESMVYEIRGQKVMLDFDLARIYGYTTKRFNEQVRRNIDKFPEDFMFRLAREETEQLSRSQILTTKNDAIIPEESLWSQKSTLNKSGNLRGRHIKYLPYAFTEQGIYMLMTVLKGELATKQSKALIRLFKKMKDFIIESNSLIGDNASLINSKFSSYDKRFEKVEEKLVIVMNNFIDPSTYKHFLILDNQRVEADVAYQTIYSLAKYSILIIDDYVNVKTLQLLKNCKTNVEISVFSDNKSKNPLTKEYLNDFLLDTGNHLSFKRNNGKCHDRYIVIDYSKDSEVIYHCGTSSKDAGNSVTTIMKVEFPLLYHPLIEAMKDGEHVM